MHSITKLTDEELLKAIQEADKNTSNRYSSGVGTFINVFKIDKGEFKVSAKTLYSLYSNWTSNSMRMVTFVDQMTSFFEICHHNKRKHFLLNIDPTKFEEIEAAKKIKKDRTKSVNYKNHFESFIKALDLKRGTFNIKIEVLHELYKQWNPKKMSVLGPVIFKEFLKLYFTTKVDHKTIYFGVDHNILNHLTDEQKLNCLSPKGQTNARKKEDKKKSN